MAAVLKVFKIYNTSLKHLRAANKIERRTGVLDNDNLNQLIASWSDNLLQLTNIKLSLKGEKPDPRPKVLVGNHISYVDIPLLSSVVQTAFVAKKEIEKFPIIGACCKRAGIVFVDRNCPDSRASVSHAISDVVKIQKRNVTIFPAGTTRMNEEKEWRYGAFKVAYEHNLPMQAFRLRYEPLRRIAYIEKDFILTHMIKLLKRSEIYAELEFSEPFYVDDPVADCERWWHWSREKLVAAAP